MRGGYRQNAGRKPGFAAKTAEEARRVLAAMVIEEIQPIGAALIARAKKGDVVAAREVFDRAFGRAPQNMELEINRVKKERDEEDRKVLADIIDSMRNS